MCGDEQPRALPCLVERRGCPRHDCDVETTAPDRSRRHGRRPSPGLGSVGSRGYRTDPRPRAADAGKCKSDRARPRKARTQPGADRADWAGAGSERLPVRHGSHHALPRLGRLDRLRQGGLTATANPRDRWIRDLGPGTGDAGRRRDGCVHDRFGRHNARHGDAGRRDRVLPVNEPYARKSNRPGLLLASVRDRPTLASPDNPREAEADSFSRLRHRRGSPAVVPVQPGHPRGDPGNYSCRAFKKYGIACDGHCPRGLTSSSMRLRPPPGWVVRGCKGFVCRRDFGPGWCRRGGG